MKEQGTDEYIKQLTDDGGYTTLLAATDAGNENVLRWLLHEIKIDVNEQNSFGITALHVAVYRRQMECARLLLDAGALQLKDRVGDTPLDCANILGKRDIAKRFNYKEMQVLIESHFQLS